jgi:hypothetical protein
MPRYFRSPLSLLTGLLAAALAHASAVFAADSSQVIEATALDLFTQNQATPALAYLDAQISAPTPAEKDLAVARQLGRVAFIFHNRRDRARAELVASLSCARAEARVVDSVLSPAHFTVFRDQALLCDLILGDMSLALDRVDAALRYISQSADPALNPARTELLERRQRLLGRQKIQQRP